MNVFSSSIIEQYIHKYYNENNESIEDINILESDPHEDDSSTTIVHYRIGDYDKYNDNIQTIHIPISELVDFTFMKFEELLIKNK